MTLLPGWLRSYRRDWLRRDVVAGLIERPRVFKHFGLPFSGRVAHLAELAIVEARAGRSTGGDWLSWRSPRQVGSEFTNGCVAQSRWNAFGTLSSRV